MLELQFEDIIRDKAPALTAVLVTADLPDGNPATADGLWNRIEDTASRLRAVYDGSPTPVNRHPAVEATRNAYKAFGKDPNRYRPSAEALMRRAVRGLELYRTTALVDLVNLVSLSTGHSIGAFDTDRIDGDTLTLGVGRAGEPYEAIGRGPLNIEGLPVWRDGTGGIGTPTSDNVRTSLSPATRRVAIILNLYATADPDADPVAMTVRLLEEYAAARNIVVNTFRP